MKRRVTIVRNLKVHNEKSKRPKWTLMRVVTTNTIVMIFSHQTFWHHTPSKVMVETYTLHPRGDLFDAL